ncbi:hypothetical protein RRG08_002568 [Elysia crispata]|uniref:DDE-1 domain-containing protein n=1 Tax=Elysia crispata TaxID=231223 RepID=A0AAE0Y4R4_9GAST|nr:hypothetical protein RRG08_002568 [Elysia crispata]
MFAGTAAGDLLPPYVIYKSENLWNTWCEGGPSGTQYGRSKNGWMNSCNFDEWFLKIVVPWARRIEGKKVMIGDNLSSHLSANVLEHCAKYDICFILLPPNSTDKCQPLDVAFFGPQKKEWRKLVEDHRRKFPSVSSVDKAHFPALLNKLISNMDLRNRANLIAGFEACGIYPFNPDRVMKKLPTSSGNTTNAEKGEKSPFKISAALLDFLQQFKYSPRGESAKPTAPRRKLAIEPGKSVSAADLEGTDSGKVKSTKANDAPLAPSPSESSDSDSECESSVGPEPLKNTGSVHEVDTGRGSRGNITDGCYAVIKLPYVGSTKNKHYVAMIVKAACERDNDTVIHEVKFMRQSAKAPGKFIFPDVEDMSEIEDKFIIKVLPPPISIGNQTKRQAQFFVIFDRLVIL